MHHFVFQHSIYGFYRGYFDMVARKNTLRIPLTSPSDECAHHLSLL